MSFAGHGDRDIAGAPKKRPERGDGVDPARATVGRGWLPPITQGGNQKPRSSAGLNQKPRSPRRGSSVGARNERR